MTTLLLCIDGTGELSDQQYQVDFRHSFVHYIFTHSQAGEKHYSRGPAATLADAYLGSDTLPLVSEGYSFVSLAYSEGDRVLLTGYSRGAAAVVAVAERLGPRQIPVAGLVLFDCVDRCPLIDTMSIPRNVEEVVHVSRDPRTQSRESFSNSGLLGSPPTIYNGERIRHEGDEGRQRRFFGTHGAMGGVFWRTPFGDNSHSPDVYVDEGFPDYETRVTFARDLECSREIWGAVYPDLCRLGFL
ncbi:MAG: DUF2235 domain-containing protein [Sandaracinaceae bacterium]